MPTNHSAKAPPPAAIDPYSHAELAALLADAKSDLVERKETFDGEAAFSTDVLAKNDRTMQERLAATKMIASVAPTNSRHRNTWWTGHWVRCSVRARADWAGFGLGSR